MNELFFELIRVAVGTTEGTSTELWTRLSRMPNSKEWKQLYEIVQKQSLVGVCFAALKRLGADADEGFARIGMDKMLYMTWMGMAVMIQKKNEQVNQYCVDLQKRLSSDGFRSCVLKGQGVGQLYAEHLLGLRQSGDIDIWLEGETDDIIRYVNRIAPFEKINQQHLDFRIYDDIEVEVHFTPSRLTNRFRNKLLQNWFAQVRGAQMVHNQILDDGNVIVVPTSDFNVVYLMLHIYRHLFGEGIGLRQCMDYYYVLKSVSLSEDKLKEVRRIVSLIGLEKFASAMMWVQHYVFGLERIYMPWMPNQRDGEFLLKEIMQMGNFGHEDSRYKLRKDDSHLKRFWQYSQSKWRFIGHFPSEVFWQPIDMFLRFFEVRILRNRASHLI